MTIHSERTGRWRSELRKINTTTRKWHTVQFAFLWLFFFIHDHLVCTAAAAGFYILHRRAFNATIWKHWQMQQFFFIVFDEYSNLDAVLMCVIVVTIVFFVSSCLAQAYYLTRTLRAQWKIIFIFVRALYVRVRRCVYMSFVYWCSADTADIVRCSFSSFFISLTTWFLFDFHFILYTLAQMLSLMQSSHHVDVCVVCCASSSYKTWLSNDRVNQSARTSWGVLARKQQTKEWTRNVWTQSISFNVSYKYGMCSQLCTWVKLIQFDVVWCTENNITNAKQQNIYYICVS